MIDALPLLLADDGYQISRSVRLRSSASAYFNRTPASAGNRKTWTWSGWVKRGDIGSSNNALFNCTGGSGDTGFFTFAFNSDQKLLVGGGTTNWLVTTAVYRDPSAYYHLVLAVDTTQATAANRVKLYVNSNQVTALDVNTAITQNSDLGINQSLEHRIGRYNTNYADFYLTEVNFIDGQALTPSSFGETDAITGVWKPQKYTGTYGTNGFYLNFSDNSNNTATTIGKDYSGNGNNWTPNNISVTSGATYDSMLDVPTPWADGGNGRGNYAVLNPLFRGVNTPGTMQAANLELNAPNNTFWYNGVGTTFVSTGKWYAEFTPLSGTTSSVMVGVANDAYRANDFPGGTGSNGYSYVSNSGNKFFNNTGAGTAYGASFTTGDVIGVALDLDAGSLTFYKNGVSQGTAFTGIAAGNWTFAAASAAASVIAANFGQRPFSYTPPSGFKALNTGNLPEPTIKKGNLYFDATTYTGTGVARSVVNAAGMQPDLVWVKGRSVAYSHLLTDSVRGATKRLISDTTAAEVTDTDTLTAFNSNGFSWGTGIGGNQNAATYVAWQWKEGATQGFDIVTFTAPSSAGNFTVAHNLGVAPSMVITKRRDSASQWWVWHTSLGNNTTSYLSLNTTNAVTNTANMWGSVGRTSTLLGYSDISIATSSTQVAYLFSEVAGFSRFGSYTGNGSADGPFVYCGFRPRFLLYKRTDAVADWRMFDAARDAYNVGNAQLISNASNAETTSTTTSGFDFLSNGFKLRNSDGYGNASGGTYIFAAFAESPFKVALAR